MVTAGVSRFSTGAPRKALEVAVETSEAPACIVRNLSGNVVNAPRFYREKSVATSRRQAFWFAPPARFKLSYYLIIRQQRCQAGRALAMLII
jgi:hypothetical protein